MDWQIRAINDYKKQIPEINRRAMAGAVPRIALNLAQLTGKPKINKSTIEREKGLPDDYGNPRVSRLERLTDLYFSYAFADGDESRGALVEGYLQGSFDLAAELRRQQREQFNRAYKPKRDFLEVYEEMTALQTQLIRAYVTVNRMEIFFTLTKIRQLVSELLTITQAEAGDDFSFLAAETALV